MGLRRLAAGTLGIMRGSRASARSSFAVVGVSVTLLAVLAALQYRWIARLSEAERARLEARLDETAASFCEDFDRQVARAYAAFSLTAPDDDAGLTRLLGDSIRKWRVSAPFPELVRDLYVIRRQPANDVELLCFDETVRTLSPCNWSPALLAIRRHLRDPGPVSALDEELPGLVLAIHQSPAAAAGTADARRPPRDHLIVGFDLAFITGTLLPRLSDAHFGAGDRLAYAVKITPTDRPELVVFSAGPAPGSTVGEADATHLLFGLRAFPDLRGAVFEDPQSTRPPPRQRRPEGAEPRQDLLDQRPPPPDQQPPAPRDRTEQGRWTLTARHPAGSLEQAVASARRRNLGISLAVLAMLGATTLLVVVSTRRAQRLARQQMDFVAAVSHELRTPLTAIRSAGQNLADGIIEDPERVRSYGLLIEREGRRLTEMLGRVLTFAGIRSGHQSYRRDLVAVPGIVDAAIEDCRLVLQQNSVELEVKIDRDLPPVRGDAGALRQVVTNLIDNAIKYGAAGRWLGVRVGFRPTSGRGEVLISVSDRGPGIHRRELPFIFEPFYRSADVASGAVQGSGLGLAVVRGIVEAHAGRVTVSSRPGRGTTFTVHLPAFREENRELDGT
ncbi:MAG: hypothetical protein C3F15_16280 [Holophagae bacterium]|nr:MAG: hypothetical protein C3F15_16280 [Holophagae bacterium]